ncbi:DUF2235 domain-containing protein [Flavobacterium sp.]|uniref:DUF2235 domain-containing protein n=1 Tax=Flavobacterium sp. TaxID=239 RepID=UPI00260C07D8|nr:DUF2235 domain-containing protein [Flavobacterium sp.]
MKRIVVCCDGTWNRPGVTEDGKLVQTNVEIMYKCVEPVDDNGIRQVKFYETGVGSSTYNKFDQIFGGLKGFGIDKKIMDIYSFVVMNYELGDELYLFGFSRGAYTARSVAGLIRNCGVLKAPNIHLVDLAYSHYRDRNSYTLPESDYMSSFRRQYCHEDITPIKFIGVWDTVGSLGLPLRFLSKYNAEKYKFHDCTLSSHVRFAYHAIAIDEHRKLFLPTLWQLSKNSDPNKQTVEQVWFPGAHSNVGGGYKNTELSDIAFEWMARKAADTGLSLKIPAENFNPKSEGTLIESRSSFYKLWPPARRPIYRIGKEKLPLSSPYEYDFVTNEDIHDSALDRYNVVKEYKPKNLKEAIEKYKLPLHKRETA